MEVRNFIVTQAKLASENEYIKKLVQGIKIAAYYDVDALVTRQLTPLKNYLLNRELGVIQWADYTLLVDKQALIKRVNLNCKACTKKHAAGCCFGSPCNYGKRNLAVFNQYQSQLIKELIKIEPARYAQLLAHQIESMSEELLRCGEKLELEMVDEKGTVTSCEGRCGLLIRKDGVARCLTHQYALENNLSVYELSPLSCLMFPLDFLVFLTETGEEVVFLTSVVEDEFAEQYGRWGRYRNFELDFECVSVEAHNEIFKIEDYKPLYEVNKDLFIHEFGEEVYEGICMICRK
mgnify:CR=1|nr:hypothetical protein [uncultured Cellulosilyticum sp.]